MPLRFRTHQYRNAVLLCAGTLTLAMALVMLVSGTARTLWDAQLLDFFYRQAVERGAGPKLSKDIVLVTITDSTYRAFGRNTLDRKALAEMNDALAEYGAAAVAYDLIFAQPSEALGDSLFAASIKNLGCAYLPIAFKAREDGRPFKQQAGSAYSRFKSEYLSPVKESGTPQTLHAADALMQLDLFADAAFSAGHIVDASDADGVSRSLVPILKADSLYFPSLSLAVFLKQNEVPMSELRVEWGSRITIPKRGKLEQDVVIPIDGRGRTFIPYPAKWGKEFEQMPLHKLLAFRKDENLTGNLTAFFEGKFVFVADVSASGTDIAPTPLETQVYLVAVHTAFLNALLTNTFYTPWSLAASLLTLALIAALLAFAALIDADAVLYLTGGISLLGLGALGWAAMQSFMLVPVVTLGACSLIIFVSLIATVQIVSTREQAFIRNAFSRYVPERVIDDLLAKPGLLKLGGEERVVSVLFLDLVGFTSLSEKLSPTALVGVMNYFMTEMTTILLRHGGTIDKYIGDAIMAEFGMPVPMDDHAPRAVRAALEIRKHIKVINAKLAADELPLVDCRIGINTGLMVVGNMGSKQVFDYTVIGDAVNLASRLEGANKEYGTYLMISEFTRELLPPDAFVMRALDVIKVKGKSQAVKVYEVYAAQGEPVAPSDKVYYEHYLAAFDHYLKKEFDLARDAFTKALAVRPNDTAATHFLDRLDRLHLQALPAEWDGSVALTHK